VAFCNALSAKEGFEPAYTINGKNVTVDFSKGGYRLPTSAEWEFAARGGNVGRLNYKFAGSDNWVEVAWLKKSALDEPSLHPVAKKKPNELGLYDMSGNLPEWCWDSVNFGMSVLVGGMNPVVGSKGTLRVSRGGGFNDGAEGFGTVIISNSAGWGAFPPDTAGYCTVRLVRSLTGVPGEISIAPNSGTQEGSVATTAAQTVSVASYKSGNGTNLAVNKRAESNSNEGDSKYRPLEAIDADTKTRWSSNRTKPGPASKAVPHYMIVDLGDDYRLNRIYLDTKGNGPYSGGNPRQSFKVLTSLDKKSWQVVCDEYNFIGKKTYNTENVARYVKFECTFSDDNGQVNLYELEIY
jgi:hypothetical protein